MIKVSVNGIAMIGNKPRVHTFTSASPLNNNNIIQACGAPSPLAVLRSSAFWHPSSPGAPLHGRRPFALLIYTG